MKRKVKFKPKRFYHRKGEELSITVSAKGIPYLNHHEGEKIIQSQRVMEEDAIGIIEAFGFKGRKI